ncbi:hypothetical protein D3C86_1553720 [compost metagenome]
MPGTYYVGYSWTNSDGETALSEVTKIYLSGLQSIDITASQFDSDTDEVIKCNFYVGYTSENLIGELNEDQQEIEDSIFKNMTRQAVTNLTFEFRGPIALDKLRPIGNSTIFRSYVGKEGSCTKCYGKNFYFDISFDASGQAVTADNSMKLLQELIKIILEDKEGNAFHPNWGCDIAKRIGTKKRGPADKFKVEMSVRSAIDYLKSVQENNQLLKRNMRPEEMIVGISSITVEEDSSTGYNVYVEVLSKAGEIIAYNVNV